jgi:hypothetical protein
MSDDSEWNGHRIPPRPPLPVPPVQPGTERTAPPTEAPAAHPEVEARDTSAAPVRRIGMPPGMEPAVDTVPSSDHAEPVPVSRPEFGVAPTPFAPAAAAQRAPGAPVTAPAPVAAPLNSPRLVLPDGAVLALTNGLIVGRDPQEQDGYGVTARARLHDVERSVSKTHAILGLSEGRIWVIDLNSTNGTVMIAADGTETLCTPEVATPLPPKTDLRFGEYRVSVAFD